MDPMPVEVWSGTCWGAATVTHARVGPHSTELFVCPRGADEVCRLPLDCAVVSVAVWLCRAVSGFR